MLVRQSEPETALDMLRQALAELNAEKKITDGMQPYQHNLNLPQKAAGGESDPVSATATSAITVKGRTVQLAKKTATVQQPMIINKGAGAAGAANSKVKK